MLGYFYYFCDGIPAFLSYLFIFYNYPIFVTVKRCKQPWDEIDRKVWPLSESFRPKRIEFLSLQWIFNGVTVKRKILMSTFYWCCLCFCWSEFIILQFSFNRGRQTAVKDYGCIKEVCFSIDSVLAGMSTTPQNGSRTARCLVLGVSLLSRFWFLTDFVLLTVV